jgi:SAM-dependent methyltransferase
VRPIETGGAYAGRHPDWNTLYREVEPDSLPWHSTELDADLYRELAIRQISSGNFLDIGCGIGTQTAALAKAGFSAFGEDISADAIALARDRFGDVASFRQHDATIDLPGVEAFKYVFDRGLMHVLTNLDRFRYIQVLAQRIAPRGLLFLKCFSKLEPERAFGPERFSVDEISEIFSPFFSVVSARETSFTRSGIETRANPQSLFLVLRRQG